MSYKKGFLKYDKTKTESSEVKITSDDIVGGVLNIVKIIGKIIGGLIKVSFKVSKVIICSLFKLISEFINFIAYLSLSKFFKLAGPKQELLMKCMVVGLLFTVGGFIGMSQKIKVLQSNNPTVMTSLASDTSKDTLVADKEDVQTEKSQSDVVAVANSTAEKDKTDNSSKAKTVVSDKEETKTNSTIESPLSEFIGTITFKSTVGDVNPGYIGTTEIRYEKNGKIVVEKVDAYGLGEFTTVKGKRYAKDFTDYLKAVDKELYEKYFTEVGKPGTTTFDTAWYTIAKNENEKFKMYQCNYIYLKYVEPTVKAVKDEYKIDLMSNKALKEFVFSTANQYGLKGTLTFFQNAKITSDMSAKEIIEKIQKEKIDSLGVYTYTDKWDYTDKDREKVKETIESELKQFLDLL